MKKKTSIALHIKALLLLAVTCLTVSPSSAQSYESYIEQGLAAAQEQHYDEAINHFRQALRLSPNDIRNALTYANIAKMQVAQGEPLKAILGYTKILDIDSRNIDALLGRAYIHQQRRDYQAAKTDYERLLTLQPDHYAALLGVAILFQNAGKPQEAIARLSTLIDQYPDKAELYSVRAEIEAEAHQPELALLDLDKAISLSPDNKNLILTRAYLHLHEGHKHLAQQDFERAIQLGVPRGQLKEELEQVKK